MKKNFLMGIAAAAMLASCSNDETVEMPQSKAISFSNAFVNKSTRTLYTDAASLATDGFEVYGFTQNGQIFSGEQVTSSDNGSTWDYTPHKYWIQGNQYTFAAIAPAANSDITVSDAAKTDDGSKVTMKIAFTNTDGETDLLYAAPDKISADASFMLNIQPVSMTFNHLLSKVKFTFKNLVGEGYNIVVNNIKITDAKSSGEYIISESGAGWQNISSGLLSLDFGNVGTDAKIANNASGATKDLLMIPYDNTGVYTVSFSITLYQGDVEMATYQHEQVNIKGVAFDEGYYYNFVAEITTKNISGGDSELQPIMFSVEKIELWKDSDKKLPGFEEETTGN